MKRLFVIAAAAGALLAPAIASADQSGAWKLSVKVGDMTIPVTCNFTQSGAALSGTCARSDAPEAPAATTGTVDGSAIKFAYDVKFQDMPLHVAYTGAVQGDGSLTGTIDVAGQTGTFTGTK